MNFPQKRKVNVAAVNKRKHDLSHCHITTMDFGRMKPIEMRYMVPGDEFNYRINSKTRVLNPMPSPTFGQFDLKYRMFFVPLHNVWFPFYDFLKNQQSVVNGQLSNIEYPVYTTVEQICNMFYYDSFGLSEGVSNPSSFTEYDYSFYSTDGVTQVYRKFTRLGRICYDFITSFGLNIPFASYGTEYSNEKINVLPFVAFWKCYFDWIVPSRFVRDHQDYIDVFIDKISNSSSYFVVAQELALYLIKEPLSYFLDDIYTTSTRLPFQTEDLQDGIELNNPSADLNGVAFEHNPDMDLNGAYAFEESDNHEFNMWTLQTLGKLQDMLNRNLLAGSKVQDWLLTEFGIRPNTDALHLSKYCGSKSNTLQIQDVISTSDTLSSDGTSGTPLGAYGGYVNERFDFDFSYKSDEHGYLFITYELVPRTSYYQGKNPEFDMLDRFDFFQPEFDNQQGSPLAVKDLFFDNKNPNQIVSRLNDVFGFNLQYSRLKFAPDVVSGDFRNRFGYELKSWFLTRDMGYLVNNGSGSSAQIDEEFCLVKSQYQDWHYIFSDMNDNLDPFLTIFYFDAPCLRPMKSITEGFEPNYKQSGKDVTLDFQGAAK